MAARIKTMMGVVVIITGAFKGEVNIKPLKNMSWLTATPNKPQRANLQKSLRSIFSFLKERIAQNKETAQMALTRINPFGPMTLGIKPFATT